MKYDMTALDRSLDQHVKGKSMSDKPHTADKARILELERSSIALINAAKAFRKETPSMSCECFHHSKADRHESDEECPPFERWCLASLNLTKAILQQEKQP